MSFIKAPTSSDCHTVIRAADALGITEFDFFRLAFRQWHGREPSARALERLFVNYMFHRDVPPPVRHLARRVLASQAEGSLSTNDFGVRPYRCLPTPDRDGPWRIALVAVLFVVYCFALIGTTYDAGTSAPMECELGPGMRLLSDFAHAVGDTVPPDCLPPKTR